MLLLREREKIASKIQTCLLEGQIQIWALLWILGWIFLYFPRQKDPENDNPSNPSEIRPEIRSEKFPSDSCRILLLTMCCLLLLQFWEVWVFPFCRRSGLVQRSAQWIPTCEPQPGLGVRFRFCPCALQRCPSFFFVRCKRARTEP